MTDLEIDKALALAIGWKEDQIGVDNGRAFVNRQQQNGSPYSDAIYFSYKDPAVIWPIGERHNVFPYRFIDGDWQSCIPNKDVCADTAAKAVALAVIGMNK